MKRGKASSGVRKLAWAACLFASSASADGGLDRSRVHRFSLKPASLATSATPFELPRNPAVRFRVRVASGILHPPNVAPDGGILLALGSATLAEYDAQGRLSFSARLGASPAATSPIVLGDGIRLVITEGAEALGFSARGELLLRRALPLANFDVEPSVAALPDGGVLIASASRVVRLDAALSIRFWTRLDSPAVFLVAGERPVIVLGNGSIYELSNDGSIRRRAGFRGRVEAAVAFGRGRLLAVVDGRRLSELDLESDSVTTRFSDPDIELQPRFASNSRNESRIVGSGELLFAFDSAGRERFRVALPAAAAPSRIAGQVLIGPDGAALVVRPGADAALVSSDGAVTRIEGTACAEPLRPAGLSPRSAVLACRSGILLRLDDKPAVASSEPIQ